MSAQTIEVCLGGPADPRQQFKPLSLSPLEMFDPSLGPRSIQMYSPTNGNKPGWLVEPRPQLKLGSIDPQVVQVIEKWKKCRERGDSFKKDLYDDVVSDLYKPIRGALEAAIKREQ